MSIRVYMHSDSMRGTGEFFEIDATWEETSAAVAEGFLNRSDYLSFTSIRGKRVMLNMRHIEAIVEAP